MWSKKLLATKLQQLKPQLRKASVGSESHLPKMSILHISQPPQSLSFSLSLSQSSPTPLFLHASLSLKPLSPQPASTFIRMGGGPRTFPGGVSKWQWKRMQAKKAKQLLKARLCRERQIYEMRKRAELKAAVSELERPWEVVEKPPNLFSVSADEQVKVLADRFQKPGGFDLWTERDGPELFRTMEDLPSARFFPKGVVHSVRPYRRVGDGELEAEEEGLVDGDDRRMYNGKMRRKGKGSKVKDQVSTAWGSDEGALDTKLRGVGNVVRASENGGKEYRSNGGQIGEYRSNGGENGQYRGNGGLRLNGSEAEGVDRRSASGYSSRGVGVDRRRGRGRVMRGGRTGQYRSNGGDNRNYGGNGGLRLNSLESEGVDRRSTGGYESRGGGVDRRRSGRGRVMQGGESRQDRRKGGSKLNDSEEVYDMRLRQDGSYEFQ